MCNACNLDQSQVEGFSKKMLEMMNQACLALMFSLGHRSRLFDVMADLPPATSAAIAGAANLQERYVREWLGAMVSGGAVEYDREARTYHLPAAHAQVLRRSSFPNSMGHLPQLISVLAGVESKVLDCFHQGGGVPYEAYPRFQEVMAEGSDQSVVAALHPHIVPSVPHLKEDLERGIRVMDIGCGSGRALNELARSYPNSRFVGYDLSEPALERARREAAEAGSQNVEFAAVDVTRLDLTDRFDLITAFDAIHDQARPLEVLQGIQRLLAPGGRFLMQDVHASSELAENLDNPMAPFIYSVSTLHCMTVSLAQPGGEGLGAAWGRDRAQELLRAAGFTEISVRQLPHDPMSDYYLAALT